MRDGWRLGRRHLLGALLGQLWSMAWTGTPAGAYALVGATALVTAAMSAPATGVLLMIERTHHLTPLLVPDDPSRPIRYRHPAVLPRPPSRADGCSKDRQAAS